MCAVACCVASGCASHQRLLGHPVPAHQPVAILVKVSDQVNLADDGGGVATLVETLSDELKENGIESQIYASNDDHPPPPRIELDVLYWHGTSRVSHKLAAASYVVPAVGVGSLATAGNRIVVDCQVFLTSTSQPAFKQRFDRWGLGLGWTQTDDNSAASKAGSAIAGRILTR